MPNPYTILREIPPWTKWFSVLDVKYTFFLHSYRSLLSLPLNGLTNRQYVLPQRFINRSHLFGQALVGDLKDQSVGQEGREMIWNVDDLLVCSPTCDASFGHPWLPNRMYLPSDQGRSTAGLPGAKLFRANPHLWATQTFIREVTGHAANYYSYNLQTALAFLWITGYRSLDTGKQQSPRVGLPRASENRVTSFRKKNRTQSSTNERLPWLGPPYWRCQTW